MCEVIDFKSKKETVERMQSVVLGVFISFFKDLRDSGANIKYFQEAKNEYKKQIRSLKDLKYFYKKIISKRYK